jgi:SAM-dependent methyltransferase
MSRTKFRKQILNFYNDFLLATSINSPESVAWSSHKSQYIRFDKLFEICRDGVVLENKSILDLGCGLGHMVDYMENHNWPTKNYTGIDINPNYILYAIQRKPNVNFLTGEIYDITDKYDYVLGSGVFTVKMPISEVLDAIEYSFNICRVGVAFNFLNKEYINAPEFNTFDPNEFYSIIKEKYPNSSMSDDYLGNEDFTIYIYK